MYLLDSNACIRILNDRSLVLTRRVAAHRPDVIYLSSVVKAELIYGAYRSSRIAENLRTLKRFFVPFTPVAFDDQCVDAYGRIRSSLRVTGTPIGANDLLIAATAITHELTLITHNVQAFTHVPGLEIKDWETE